MILKLILLLSLSITAFTIACDDSTPCPFEFPICNEGTCEVCSHNDNCTSSPFGLICGTAGTCECIRGSNCGIEQTGSYCNQTLKQCMCLIDSDCILHTTGYACVNNACACRDNTHCPASNPICKDNQCSPCTTDDECSTSRYGITCDTGSGACQCSDENGCTEKQQGSRCKDNSCVCAVSLKDCAKSTLGNVCTGPINEEDETTRFCGCVKDSDCTAEKPYCRGKVCAFSFNMKISYLLLIALYICIVSFI